MNGSLFGTYKVIANFSNMISCMRTTRNPFTNLLMLLFMLYHTVTFLLQLFALGAMYASVSLFLSNYVRNMAMTEDN